ncbi:GntR family transcriptional regulator [Azospirillum canadense]|uniref:GntR family transcriptional regulator n=1 Tax=Azospirillum canadense TaxID=403962 RepID=UPI00222628C2|nr:GntR family transcriptional regulator [Azospirillum canadense]MCW2239227.1 DNA-binding GntR family transcriptional regulator [Azospirillum canadense]
MALTENRMAMPDSDGRPTIPAHGGTVDYVVDHLRSGMLQGRYAPGQRLIEADLTRDLRVSRGPLREAFRRLSAEGLIEIVPHRGALVRRLTLREMTELFQIRQSLEMLAARLAAEAMTDPAVRARFETDIEPIWNDAPRVASLDYIDENHRFHDAIVAASGNEQLMKLTRQLRLPVLMSQLISSLKSENIAASLAEHRAIARAILAGDGKAAEERVTAHLQRALGVAEAMPNRVFSP